MTAAENQNLQDQRKALAQGMAGTLLDELPERWQRKLEGKVVELLLSVDEGLNTDAASTYIAEKCDEWAQLPGQESNRHLRADALEKALGGDVE